jgi:hypothetical protein
MRQLAHQPAFATEKPCVDGFREAVDFLLAGK